MILCIEGTKNPPEAGTSNGGPPFGLGEAFRQSPTTGTTKLTHKTPSELNAILDKIVGLTDDLDPAAKHDVLISAIGNVLFETGFNDETRQDWVLKVICEASHDILKVMSGRSREELAKRGVDMDELEALLTKAMGQTKPIKGDGFVMGPQVHDPSGLMTDWAKRYGVTLSPNDPEKPN